MPENSILMTEKNEKNPAEVSNKDHIKDLSVKNTERHPKNTRRWKWKKILIFCLPFLVLIAILIFAPVITIIIGIAFGNINGKNFISLKVSKSQNNFFLKLHCPKMNEILDKILPYMKLGQNFVKYFVRFLGNGVSRNNVFEIY